MTLCGVLKDIMLVAASIAIWGTPVSALQYFGYSIALGGMVWYKLGGETIKSYLFDGRRRWAEYGQSNPTQRRVVIIVLSVVTVFVLMGGLGPAAGYDTSTITSKGNELYSTWTGKAAAVDGSV